ncbi:MAG: DUF4955 domain-containing protein [Bacteroidota bacterium]
MHNLLWLSISLLLAMQAGAQEAQIWKKYIGGIKDVDIPTLPNYSYAGYRLGGAALPKVHDLDTFNVVDFGAQPNDKLSDDAAIQRAIDAAASNRGGLVYFPPGVFDVLTNPKQTSSITISSSNIVLHGSGAVAGGTIINMQNHMLLPPGENPWDTPVLFEFRGFTGSTVTRLAQTVKRGEKIIKVVDASGFTQKKYLRLKVDNSLLASKDFLQGQKTRNLWKDINEVGADLIEYHEIESIDLSNNTIRLKDPIIDTFKVDYDCKIDAPDLLENCGFERIHLQGNFLDSFVHHKNYIHDYGWHGVRMTHVAHSWITESRFSNVTLAAKINGSYASSILKILVDGNSGHALTAIDGGATRILQGLLWDNTSKGQWHGADISGRACGSVTWRVEAPNSRGVDLHASYPRTNLVDLYESSGISGQGGNIKNLPHHLPGLTIWNSKRTGGQQDHIDLWPVCESTYCGWTLVNPVIVGYHGVGTTFKQSALNYEESNGRKVNPTSLYEAQNELRLENREWIDEALLRWDLLKDSWYGEPTNLKVVSASKSYVEISWSDNSAFEDAFEVLISEKETNRTVIQVVTEKYHITKD